VVFFATISLSVRHASDTPARTCRNDGRPQRGSDGKYVPPQNGAPSGAMNMVSGQPPCSPSACSADMYRWSMSGRSSRSTLMLTNRSFITAAVAGSSNDSCAMTWHQ